MDPALAAESGRGILIIVSMQCTYPSPNYLLYCGQWHFDNVFYKIKHCSKDSYDVFINLSGLVLAAPFP
jgi:hypothetical protein